MINTTLRTAFFTTLLLLVIFNDLFAQVSVNEQEPNNTIATANYVGVDTVMNGTICPAGLNADVDYFKIVLPSDGVLKIKASVTQDTITGRLVALDFGLFNKQGLYMNGYALASDSPHNFSSDSAFIPCLNADTFYIRVYNDAFTNDCHTYSFSYSVIAPVFGSDTAAHGNVPVFVPPSTYQPAHNNYYPGNNYEDFTMLKIDSFGMEVYIKASTQSGDSTDQLQIFYADNVGNIGGYIYVPAGVNNQIKSDSIYIPGDTVKINPEDSFQLIPSDTLSLRINFNANDCGSYEIYYTGKPTGINTVHGLAGNISIYPNPSIGLVRFTFNTPQKENITCDVFTVMGEEVYKTIIPSGEPIAELDLSLLPKGMYFARLSNGQNATTKMLVIQ